MPKKREKIGGADKIISTFFSSFLIPKNALENSMKLLTYCLISSGPSLMVSTISIDLKHPSSVAMVD